MVFLKRPLRHEKSRESHDMTVPEGNPAKRTGEISKNSKSVYYNGESEGQIIYL